MFTNIKLTVYCSVCMVVHLLQSVYGSTLECTFLMMTIMCVMCTVWRIYIISCVEPPVLLQDLVLVSYISTITNV